MNVYLVTIPIESWYISQDYAMVVVAEDEKHAERKARWSSDEFRKNQEIKVKKINLSQEQCVLVANIGS